MLKYDFLVIGGGAAGFFAAINVIQKNPTWKVAIIEKQGKVLQKVKVSGGGRCNVTNSISEPALLASNYPRGEEFLKKSFGLFSTSDTQAWFEKRGVRLKTEKDGRVFPITDSSQTIIDCFLKESKNVDLVLNTRVESINKEGILWGVKTTSEKIYQTKNLMIATGSDRRVWEELARLKLPIADQVPSLFTFNISDKDLQSLQGVSFTNAKVSVKGTLQQTGPLLITHWGLSGPAILKLSAWGAYILKEKSYNFTISVNWIPDLSIKHIESELKKAFETNAKKNIRSLTLFGLTQRFWNYICIKSGISEFQKGAESGKKQIASLIKNLTDCELKVEGKSTFKEEFVTAGGVILEEVNPTSFNTLSHSNLYLGGEVLHIDAITGGFNFQAAWTAGYLISQHLKEK